MSFWLHAFDRTSCISIEDVDKLDDSRAEERSVLQAQGIRSLIAVPLRRGGEMIGFLGIDDPAQQQSRVDRLNAIGDYVAVMLTRRDLSAKIERDNQALLGLMNDTPGGFARLCARPDGSVVCVFLNQGFCELLGMTEGEIMQHYRESALWGIHPDDLPSVKATLRSLVEARGTHSARFRLLHASGAYKWFMVFSRSVESGADGVYINVYYTDATELTRLEAQQRDLIENLPCGAGMYAYADGRITILYLNRRYLELIGRKPEVSADITELLSVRADDRPKLRTALRDNLELGRRIECDLHILHGADEYRLFHLSGSSVRREDGSFVIYTTYLPISEGELAFRRMLPVALEAMMNASPDIAFVKDRDLTYISCSHPFALLAGLPDAKSIVGKTDYDLVDRDLADAYSAVDREIMASRKPQLNYIERLPSADGTVHYATTSKYLLYDAEGNVIGIYGVGRDVTEERAAYARLKLLTDSMPGGLATYVCTPDSLRIAYFNDRFCKLLGYTREEYAEICSESAVSMVYPEDLPTIQRQMQAMMQENKPIDCTYRVRTKDNACRWINLRGEPSERHGDAVTVNAALYDVTQRMEAEERLRISEQEMRLALSQMGKMVLLFDARARTLTMPEAYSKKHGLPAVLAGLPESLSQSGVVDPKDGQAFGAFFEAILRGEQTGSVEAHIACPGGFWAREHAEFVTVFGSDGTPAKAIISIEDVTAQREKDEKTAVEMLAEVQHAREYERLFFDAAAGRFAGIVKVDLRTGDASRVDFENGGPVVRPMGMDWDAFFRSLLENVHPDDREMVLRQSCDGSLARIPAGGSVNFTYRSRHGGGYRWYTTTLRASVDDAGAGHVTAFTSDLGGQATEPMRSATLFTVDINDEMIERARLKDLSEHDGLTDLFNRVKYESLLDTEYKSLRSCGILFFDVNFLKETNDTMGHDAGDSLICLVADGIRSITNRRVHGYRYGGDEFLVVACNAQEKDLDHLAAMWATRLHTLSADSGIAASVAVGRAWSAAPLSVDELIRLADQDMYKNKAEMKQSCGGVR